MTQENKAVIVIGAILLGALLLKAIFDRQARGFRCPECGLVIRRETNPCPRCHTELDWQEASCPTHSPNSYIGVEAKFVTLPHASLCFKCPYCNKDIQVDITTMQSEAPLDTSQI